MVLPTIGTLYVAVSPFHQISLQYWQSPGNQEPRLEAIAATLGGMDIDQTNTKSLFTTFDARLVIMVNHVTSLEKLLDHEEAKANLDLDRLEFSSVILSKL